MLLFTKICEANDYDKNDKEGANVVKPIKENNTSTVK